MQKYFTDLNMFKMYIRDGGDSRNKEKKNPGIADLIGSSVSGLDLTRCRAT